ncbi:ABC transporter substrate-binding protein [Rhodospirillaceae bacterium AH-315-P19]|nr:ABC transporter substrate-binding protein [Rhodospirillaceae bacterium AH-315-P19]
MRRRSVGWKVGMALAVALFLLPAVTHAPPAMAQPSLAQPIRIGALKFGSVAWELDVIAHHGLDRKHGFSLDIVPLASTQALKVALQAGGVDVILADWLWVSRIRQSGSDVTFAPYGAWAGALMVPAASKTRTLGDLGGLRIGVAGGPINKNWLLLQALAVKEEGLRLADEMEIVFAAPPLLRMEMQTGRLDAVLTYWQDAAMLQTIGFRRMIDTAEVARRLGVSRRVPFLGYVFSSAWAESRRDALLGFLAASREAKAILRHSDAEWERLAPLTRTDGATQLHTVRDAYRRGLLEHWGEEERRAAEALFGILAKEAGASLTGGQTSLAPGTFWAEDRF